MCTRRSWERFDLRQVAGVSGGFNIISHHGTALTLKDGSVYASKVAVDGPPLTVSFVPAVEPTGVTRFVPENQGEKRVGEAGAEAAAKRSKASPAAAGAASSPAVSPTLSPPLLPDISPHTVYRQLTEMGHADVAAAWMQKHATERAVAQQAQP